MAWSHRLILKISLGDPKLSSQYNRRRLIATSDNQTPWNYTTLSAYRYELTKLITGGSGGVTRKRKDSKSSSLGCATVSWDEFDNWLPTFSSLIGTWWDTNQLFSFFFFLIIYRWKWQCLPSDCHCKDHIHV